MEIEATSMVNQDDLLWRQLKTIPAFRAFLRAVEARFYYSIDLSGKVLDVGCGDGHFSEMIFAEPVAAGIDPWWNPLKKSQKGGMYHVLAQAMGNQLPFNDATFDHAFSNSVLEHIPDIQPVLNDVSRVLKENGRFVITTPSHYFTEYLGGAGFFERIGMDSMAGQYRKFFNGISRHAHTDPPEVWAERLAQAGFAIERWHYYFSKEALRALEFGHVQGVPSALSHVVTGHWILAPWERSLRPTEQWLRPYYDEPFGNEGAYMLIIARKQSNGPIAAYLPQARPFSIAELEANLPTAVPMAAEIERRDAEGAEGELVEEVVVAETAVVVEAASEPEPAQKKRTDLLSIGLAALSLFCVMMGQSILSGRASDPIQSSVGNPAEGFGWFIAAFFFLFIIAWRTHIIPRPHISMRLPKIDAIPRQRWFFLLALLLSFIAYRFTSNPGTEKPLLALLLWLAAIGVGYFSLTDTTVHEAENSVYIPRLTVVVGLVLLGLALLVRFLSLSHLPGMLSGYESILGLDAVNINKGGIRNPFGTSTLTNPTLLIYLTAVPIRILGQTVTAVRFLSPLIGSFTVLALFLLGQRIWGQAIAILAAVLLAGSYLHIHFSRMGMTNIWDPLLVLLVLGLMALAWQRPSTAKNQRTIWLWAGLFLGLSMYGFTSSRLLPIMLALIFLLWLLFDRAVLQAQFGHLLTAVALAFIVALPILLYYVYHAAVFWERFNALVIFDGQSGWLAQEAQRFGVSQWEIFRQQFWRSMLAFNGTLDRSPAFQPLTSLLSFGTAVLMVVGFLISLIRLRHFKYSLLLVWVTVTLFFSGVIVVESPQSHRLIIAAPALTILAGIGLAAIGQFALLAFQSNREETMRLDEPGENVLVWKRPFPLATVVFLALLGFALLFSVSEIGYYYGRYPQDNNFADPNTERADKIARYINNFDGEAAVYLYGPGYLYVDFPTFTYLLAAYQKGVNLFDVAEDGTFPPSAAQNLLFFYVPERFGEMDSTRAMFPNGRTVSIDGQYGQPLFQVYEVSQ